MKNELNDETKKFVDELKKRKDVLAVILFGSWARGNNRPGSDVDLVVILKKGFRRTVEYRNKQAFEIIYTTEKAAFDFWKNNKDDATELWEVAEILYDKNGIINKLKNKTMAVIEKGKKPIDEFQLKQFRFDAEDQLKYVEDILDNEPAKANMILTNKIFNLTELFFDIRQMWIPSPKQRFAKIQKISPEFHSLLQKFYQEENLKEKLKVARKIIPIVFQN